MSLPSGLPLALADLAGLSTPALDGLSMPSCLPILHIGQELAIQAHSW